MKKAIPAVIFLALVALTAATGVPWAKETPVQTVCGKFAPSKAAKARLQVVGTKLQASDGTPFMPYGVSVVSGPQTVNWRPMEKAAAAQITAAHKYWHGNAMRIQIGERLVFQYPTRGKSYNVAFMRSVDRLVCQVIRQGDVPVINVTSIFTGREPGPRARTVRFWRLMAQRYGNHLPVIFDLYNEPQVTHDSKGHFLPEDRVWRIWRSGGTAGGVRYVGMQDLVTAIRVKEHAKNVIWAEEPYYTTADRASLELLPKYQLKGADIMYAFHKPNMDQSSRSFQGVKAVVNAKIPLIDSEWGQFAATDRPWMCQPDSYRTAPRYLQFLRSSGIGMLAWSLQPGALVQGRPGADTVNDGADLRFTSNPAALARPTQMRPDYGCTSAARGQGAGQLVMDYFARYSKRPPSRLFPQFR